MGKWRYFRDSEVVGLKDDLIARLDQARGNAGVPFTITSGLRTQEQNTVAGGAKDSAHLRGLAVDLICIESMDRFKMIRALLGVGMKRLGLYDRHIHADIDGTLAQDVLWQGLSH